MIDSALKLIRDELHSYFLAKNSGGSEVRVIIDNIASLETNGSSLDDSIIITLVNIEEDNTFKSTKTLMKTVVSDKVSYEKRPAYLNLYILICSNFRGGSSPSEKYVASIKLLSDIVRFFQAKNYFTPQNSPNASVFKNSTNGEEPLGEFDNFKLTMDIFSLSLEQINHLWGSLGGKQLPFVMYKARVIEVEEKQLGKEGALITGLGTRENVL